MPTTISRLTVQELMNRGLQIVEVLPKSEYEEEHLPEAINIPLKELNAARASALRKDLPIVFYCNDYL
ncbi:MAG: rhodanese-like domain-containing protein [SAR202 cluster bacterium]|nr:rhodanese-like domain-containing protein [SAR202 cluster bacterium]